MKRLLILILVGLAVWQGFGKYKAHQSEAKAPQEFADTSTNRRAPAPASTPAASNYRCDGRTFCSQMTSCEEATWFLRNCPDTKMDGNNDGVPCEKQWCR
jgi:predicted negative regulator of RcsB-dependent stress response